MSNQPTASDRETEDRLEPSGNGSEVLDIVSRVRGFVDAMREQGIHVGLGTPPRCPTCDEAWPCSAANRES